ncbi:MAG TPA: DUF2127 domain-containing protein [Rhizomicrobium sp.]|nr:DUF2127 domain-containing protein [Rhizomicrobium sp.]
MKKGAAAHAAYLFAITVKGVDGIIETLLGLFIAIAGPEKLYLDVLRFTTPELEENPASHAMRALQNGAVGLTHISSTFAITYLLVHGVLKAVLAICLLAGQRWIFPLAVAILSAFVFYMGYRMTVHWSLWTLGFALFDLFTVALIVNEWVRSGSRSE